MVKMRQNVDIGCYESPLRFFTDEGKPDVARIVRFLGVSRKELAKSFGLKDSQLRPDRMKEQTKARIKELACTIEDVAKIFEEDETSCQKTQYWFNTPNVHFGNSIPKNLILSGLYQQVYSFIQASKEGC